jgi:catechol 2,3-dioxygenase-like lactoylglutathione lyase family enzyme
LRLRSLQHVSTPFPPGEQAAIRAFYGELLGLIEIEPPASLSHLELVWFSAGLGLELHFFPGDTDPGAARHFCLDVDDLEETRQQLRMTGLRPYDETIIPNRPRFFCRDPIGNLIEFTSIQPANTPST